jgi:hypothetical protein
LPSTYGFWFWQKLSGIENQDSKDNLKFNANASLSIASVEAQQAELHFIGGRYSVVPPLSLAEELVGDLGIRGPSARVIV